MSTPIPRNVRRHGYMVTTLLLGLIVFSGCEGHKPPPPDPAPLAVPVSHPIQRYVTDYVDFTGRTEAVHSVNVVARATGYLVKIPFEEGADVKQGQLLFQIDPQPYEAQVRLGEAQVAFNAAQVDLATQNFTRTEALVKQNAISQQEVDQYKTALGQAKAQLDSSKANLEIYRLNLQYTRVTSPIDGQVSRYFLTLGNLVNQDQTLLTTVVSLDPMYAYFDVDQRTLLRIRQEINAGKVRSRRASRTSGPELQINKSLAVLGLIDPFGATISLPTTVGALGLATTDSLVGAPEIPLLLGMPGTNQYPHQGVINFSNNQLNPNTGSISVRGIFPNPKPANGLRLMSPGMFVRIRLPIGSPHPAVLVIDRAIQSEQGQKYVYVVGEGDKAEYRQVVTGPLQDDGLRVITSGLAAEDWIVVGALQQIRPNMKVTTEQTAMPSFGQNTARR